jgi:uncharacterized protein YkwD
MSKFKQLLLAITCLFSVSLCSFASNTSINHDALTQQNILYYVNAYRAKHHLAPLKLNETASEEAAQHSRDMANKSVPFGHTQFNQRIKHLYKKLEPCRGGAENVAYYKMNAKLLVDGWIASPGHRQNIMGNYNVTGIGIAHGKPGWGYFTQIFVRTDNKAYA